MANDTHNPASGAGTAGKRPSTNRRHRRRKLKLLPTIIAAVILLGLLACLVIGGWVLMIAKDLPEITETALAPSQTSIVYDKDGEVFSSLHGTENRMSVEYDKIPTYLLDLIVATEDTRFYNHPGVDVYRVFGAAFANLGSGGYSQGASTITMQLARNAILETQEKKFSRKIRETLIAIQLERLYTKNEILTLYLNEAFLGHNAYGIQAASHLYFDKDVSEISMAQAALLAGMLRAPNAYSPINDVEKSNHIKNVALDNLLKYKPEYAEQIALAKEEAIVIPNSANTIGTESAGYQYPWFTDAVIAEAEPILTQAGFSAVSIYTSGFNIYTTADPTIQQKLEELYANDANFPSSSTGDIVESAALFMDPTNGAIRAMVGGREYSVQRGFNRAIDLKRQPGSTIKPISVYAPALESGYSPASTVVDAPTTFGGGYKPTNYDGSWRGHISMRTAVMFSVNVPAVKFLQAITPDVGLKYAMDMGLPLSKTDDANLSLALGGITTGVSPRDMAGAYSTFANQGVYTTPYCITKITDFNGKVIYEAKPQQRTVLTEQSAYLMTDMLVSVTQGGTGTNARMNRPVASKTGTTQLPDKAIFKNKSGNKDAWFAAFTPELCGVVWMGYDNDVDENGNPQYLRQIYGGKYPALIWKAAATAGLSGVPVKQFTNPGGIVSLSVDKLAGLPPSDLTPQEYIGSDIFAKNYLPSGISDIWTVVDVCTESGLLASQYCPDHSRKAMLKIHEEINIVNFRKAADGELYVPETVCNLHNSSTVGHLVSVVICTDPSHSTQTYLANIPKGNAEGGCPKEYQVTLSYAPGKTPTEYCPIAEHAVKGAAVTQQPNIVIGDDGDDVDDNQPAMTLDTPQGLKIKSKVDNDGGVTVTVTWADGNDSSYTLYVIERITDNDDANKEKFSTYGRRFEDTSTQTGHDYQYRIYAYQGDNNALSSWSQPVSITL